jgi:MFS family permease
VVTATAHSLPVVVAGRAIQGLGGGGLVPVTLAMVAARWPPDARGLPLGVVGAVQEFGSVLGPLYGAAIVAVASWRAIFWINVPVVLVLGFGLWWTRPRDEYMVAAAGRPGAARAPNRPRAARRDAIGLVLAVVGVAGLAIGLDAPASLATSTTFGRAWSPIASGPWAPFTTPIVLVATGVLVAFVCWEALSPWVRPLAGLGSIPGVLRQSDLPGAALLGVVLGCIVVAFSTADPSKQVVASSAPIVAPLALAAALAFWWRQRRARVPLIEPGAFAARPAWGALAVNLALGGALMAVLVNVPLFARATVDPNSEVDAALVLVRFLVAVPIGALLGGYLCRHRGRAPVIAAGGMFMAAAALLAMATWNSTALGGGARWSDFELVVGGLGFGLAIAPVNVALLGAVRPSVHALASAFAVVARTVGMMAGLSALTAIALHRFYQAQTRIGSPFQLCPKTPTNCPAYDNATTAALLSELHTIYFGAAICALAAAVMSAVLLRGGPARPVNAGAEGTTTWSGLRPQLD